MATSVLVDTVQVYNVSAPITVGFEVQRPIIAASEPVPGLVQSTTLVNAVESRTQHIFSIKVAQATALAPGQVVKVISCVQEPDLVGKLLLVDKVSLNGAAILRKAVASDFETVNQEGKGDIA